MLVNSSCRILDRWIINNSVARSSPASKIPAPPHQSLIASNPPPAGPRGVYAPPLFRLGLKPGPRRSKRSHLTFARRTERISSPPVIFGTYKCIAVKMPMVQNGHAKVVGKRPSENDFVHTNVKHTGTHQASWVFSSFYGPRTGFFGSFFTLGFEMSGSPFFFENSNFLNSKPRFDRIIFLYSRIA